MTIARTLFDPAIDDFPAYLALAGADRPSHGAGPAHRRGPGRGGRGAGRLQGAGLEAGARVALAVAATCLLGQLAVSQLKHYTTPPRPYDLETLGGYTPYPLHWWTCASPGGRCIAQRARRRGLRHAEPVFRRLGAGAAGLALGRAGPGLGAGLGFSAVRVLQGAHFLSQTVWSAALLWFLGRWCSIR